MSYNSISDPQAANTLYKHKLTMLITFKLIEFVRSTTQLLVISRNVLNKKQKRSKLYKFFFMCTPNYQSITLLLINAQYKIC